MANESLFPRTILRRDPIAAILASTVFGVIDTTESDSALKDKRATAQQIKDFTLSGLAAASIAVTPGGALAATNLQAAVTELDSEKQPNEHTGHVTSRPYYPTYNVRMITGTAPTANTINLFPFVWHGPEKVTISEISSRVTTVTAAGNFQHAIYAADPTTGLWTGNPLATTSSLSTASAALVPGTLSANVQLVPGTRYWWAENVDNATTTFTVLEAATPFGAWHVGGAAAASVDTGATTKTMYWSMTGKTFGTWPNLTGVAATEVFDTRYAVPTVMKIASIP